MIDVAALQALRSVAECGTLVRAADELGFTASAISQQIKRLEKHLGTPVLAPAGRGVVLTPAGHAVVESSSAVFGALERCTEAARSVAAGAPRGTLRVAGFSTGIRGLLAPVVHRLSTQCPDLHLHLSEMDADPATRAVDAGAADLALIHDADGLPAQLPPSLMQRRVHVDIGDIVMRGDHPLASGAGPLTSAELSDCTWVTSPPGTVCNQWFRRLFESESRHPDTRHLIDDFSTQLALVAAEGVVALIPRLARPQFPAGLVARPLTRPPRRVVSAIWRRSSDVSPSIRKVLSELTEG